jgi:hypothetical protein
MLHIHNTVEFFLYFLQSEYIYSLEHTNVCPPGEKSDVSGPIRSVKCAVVFNVLCKRSQCVAELCPDWPIWRRDLTPSTHGTCPLPHAWHWQLSLPTALNKDGPGQCSGQSRAAQSGICSHRTVYVHIVLYFSWETWEPILYLAAVPSPILHPPGPAL